MIIRNSNTAGWQNNALGSIFARVVDLEDTSHAVPRYSVIIPSGGSDTVPDSRRGSTSGFYTVLIEDPPVYHWAVFAAASGSWDATYTFDGNQLLVVPPPD